MKHTELYFMIRNIILFSMIGILVVGIISTILYITIKGIINRLFKKNCGKCKYCRLRTTPWWYNCSKRQDIKNWKGEYPLEHWEKCDCFEKKGDGNG